MADTTEKTVAEELKTAVARLRCQHTAEIVSPYSLDEPGPCGNCGAPYTDEDNVSERLRQPLASWLESTAKNFDEDVYKDDIGCNAGTSLGVAHCDVDCPGHQLRAMCDRCGNPIDAPDLIRCHCWDDALAVARVLNGGEAGSRG